VPFRQRNLDGKDEDTLFCCVSATGRDTQEEYLLYLMLRGLLTTTRESLKNYILHNKYYIGGCRGGGVVELLLCYSRYCGVSRNISFQTYLKPRITLVCELKPDKHTKSS
jgi:hypothetical protein